MSANIAPVRFDYDSFYNQVKEVTEREYGFSMMNYDDNRGEDIPNSIIMFLFSVGHSDSRKICQYERVFFV